MTKFDALCSAYSAGGPQGRYQSIWCGSQNLIAPSTEHRPEESCCSGLQAVLAAPMGIIRLMDMLGEREVIRNEALILLSGLVRGNATMQQIAAFEGAFERLLGIVR